MEALPMILFPKAAARKRNTATRFSNDGAKVQLFYHRVPIPYLYPTKKII